MANYNESPVAGIVWTRAKAVHINNPYNQMPSITFEEEDVFQVGETLIQRNANNISFPSLFETMAKPAEQFELKHPETDEVLGSASYTDFHVMLYSLYRHLAHKRDNQTPVEGA